MSYSYLSFLHCVSFEFVFQVGSKQFLIAQPKKKKNEIEAFHDGFEKTKFYAAALQSIVIKNIFILDILPIHPDPTLL